MTDTVRDTNLAGMQRQFDFTTDYDEGTTDGLGVWARFSGLTGDSFTIQAKSLNPSESAYINGFQIIGTDSVVLHGDYNHNGIVDAADYVVWRNGLGTTYTQADYDVWRTHFGKPPGSGSGARKCGRSRAIDLGDADSYGGHLLPPATPGRVESSNNSLTCGIHHQPSMPCKTAISIECESHPANRSLGWKQPGR